MFKNLLLLKVFLFITYTAEASPKLQKFEGSINLKKETVFDTSFITIQVKGVFVRIDEFDKRKSLQKSYIVNLNSESVLVLSPKKKLYTEVFAKTTDQSIKADTQLIKTENYMDINGYKCYQIRVKCKSKNTEVAYWVTHERFDFFSTLVRILRDSKVNEDLFVYFPSEDGIFPLLTVERTLLRKEKMKLAVANINSGRMNDNSFKIPADYQKIER